MPRGWRRRRMGPHCRFGQQAAELFRIFTMFPRMAIIRILSDGDKSSGEIYDELINRFSLPMPRSLLYYHLDALEKIGVIGLKEYRETGKGGAPEKVWTLKIRRIIFDLTRGEIQLDSGEKTEKIEVFKNVI